MTFAQMKTSIFHGSKCFEFFTYGFVLARPLSQSYLLAWRSFMLWTKSAVSSLLSRSHLSLKWAIMCVWLPFLATELQPWWVWMTRVLLAWEEARTAWEKSGLAEHACRECKTEASYKEGGRKSELGAKAVKSLFMCDPPMLDIS